MLHKADTLIDDAQKAARIILFKEIGRHELPGY